MAHTKSEYLVRRLNNAHIKAYADMHREYYSRSGFYQHAAEHSVRRSRPSFYLIMLCTGGKGTYVCKDQTYEIEDGDLIICYPNVRIEYKSSAISPWSLYWIHFDLAEESPVIPFFYSRSVNPDRPVCRISNKLELIKLFEKIIHYQDVQEDELLFSIHQNYFMTLLHQSLLMFHRTTGEKPYVQMAVDYIDSHLHEKITLDDLSEYVRLSKYHLARLLAGELHMTPSRYITAKRMERARTLLAASSLSIADIAAQTGYDTSMYFSNVFRKETGLSPTSYRRHMRS